MAKGSCICLTLSNYMFESDKEKTQKEVGKFNFQLNRSNPI